MDKTNIVNTFTEVIDQLRNTECSQEEKIACFQRIAECITAPSMATQLNYATYISKATNVLLLFCEDLDSIIRMSAEENLNKIFRVLERTRVNRILMDLYGEIKRNGNQRSLRICLKIFAYYAQNIREHHIRWYAQNLLPCMQVIAKRKETQLQETLSEFVAKFGKYVQQGLTDSETCKLFEIFIFNVSSDCPVKRRSSAQNCINLIENARNKKLMGEYALNKIMDLLLTDQQNTTIIGALGFLRQLIPTIVRIFVDERWNDSDSSHSFSKSSEDFNSEEFYQILEIYDYCLYLVRSSSTQNHTIINASLEVINAVLQCTNGSTSNDDSQQKNIGVLLKHIIVDKRLQHTVVLKKPNTLKNQILNLYNSEEENCSSSFNSPARASYHAVISGDSPKDLTKGSAMRLSSNIAWRTEMAKQQQVEHEQEREGQLLYKRHTARSVSECVDIDYVDEEAQDDDDDFTTLSEINETQQHTHSSLANMDLTTTNSTVLSLDSTIDDNSNDAISGHCDERANSRSLLVNFSDEKSNQLCNIDTDSVNSIEFKANISRGLVVEGINQAVAADDGYVNERNKRKNDSIILSANKSSSSNSSTDAFQTFFNNINAASETVSKLFRHSSKHRSPTATDTVSLTSTATSDSKRLESDIEVIDVSSPDTSKTFPTPSTARLDEFDKTEVSHNKAKDFESYKEFTTESTPLKRSNRNPFLANGSSFKDSSSYFEAPLPVDIGSIYDQSLIFYTARLISARFLLTGSLYSRHNDSNVRVSIKSISLNVLSQCVRLNPEILQIPLKFMSSEIITTKTYEDKDRCGKSNVEQDCEHLSASDSGGNTLDGTDFIRRSSFSSQLNVLKTEAKEIALLEIKDDHFGKSSNDFNFNSMIAKSADPVLLKSSSKEVHDERKSLESKRKILSTSHIDGLDEFSNVDKDTIPIIIPPKPPKRVKSLRKSKIIENASEFSDNIRWKADGTQCLSDMLYLYNHHDPILRAGIQSIIGNYLLSNQIGLVMDMKINLQYLLAILCAGLEDEIHTVVIQALNTFDKIFPYVMSKYSKSQSIASRQCNRQQSKEDGQKPNKNVGCQENSKKKPKRGEDYHCSCCCYCFSCVSDAEMTLPDFFQASNEKTIFRRFGDNDEVISTLLKAFQLQSNFKCGMSSSYAQVSSAIETEMLVNEKRTTTAGVSIGDAGADHNASQENNAEELKSQQQKASTSSFVHCRSALFVISPKLLLNKLRLCHNNKYWLVQTKYAEVISNLNFSAMRTYYESGHNSFRDDFDNADYICYLKNSFMDELLQLIGDDDVRVREQAAKCLCHFIVQNAKQDRLHNVINSQSEHSNIPFTTTTATTPPTATTTTTFAYNINFQLLANFFDYSIFNDMAPSLRYIFDNNLMFTKPTTTIISHNSMENHLQREYSEEILSTILYRMTNKLMSLQDKNTQFGIIYAIKILLKHFTLTDFANVWFEFNFMEIFTKFSQYNYSTALDLTCQSDLIDVSSKLVVGCIIFNPDVQQYRDSNLCLLKHTMKIINIYYHLFTNQKPLIMAKGQKMDLFSNTKELAITQSIGYFGSEYIYTKLYQNLKSAYDNYRITINEEAGSKLISLLKSSLNSLNACIEMLPHDGNKYVGVSGVNNGSNGGGGGLAKNAPDANTVLPAATNALAAVPGLKLIEETLQYLAKVINYAPEECIACLRQLLKYLFARNYGNRQQGSKQQPNLQQHEQKRGHYLAFTKSYFTAKTKGLQNIIREDVESHQTKTTTTATFEIKQPPPLLSSLTWGCGHSVDGSKCGNDGSNNMPYNYLLLVELFTTGYEFRTWKSESEAEFSKHIKFFEPIVIYCLTLFLKSNGRVQASILDLLTLLLDLNVTYNILDAKNVIYDHVIKNLDIIENGIARNGQIVVGPMIRFLIKLSSKSERNVISMPKIISITNNLLANCNIRETAIEALKTLAYELFLIATNNPKNALRNIASNDCILRTAHQAASEAKKQTNSLTLVTGNLLSHSDNNSSITSSRNNKELDTQKEVVLGMLEKFIESVDCQQVLSLLLLIEQLQQQQYRQQLEHQHSDNDSVESKFSLMREEDVLKQQMSCLPNPDVVCGMICQAICANRLRIRDWRDFCLADVFFKNNFKHLLSNSRDFMALLKFVIEVDVANFSDLSYATIILSNVILKTEEIYLVNHIKLYLKNHPAAIEKLRQRQNQHQQLTTTEHLLSSRCLLDIDNDKPSTSSAAAAVAQTYVSTNISEINYFATVLCGLLEDCLTILTSQQQTPLTFSRHFAAQYTHLAANFVHTLHEICFSSHLDNVLYTNICCVLTTGESKFLNIYYNLLILNISQGTPASVLNANNSFSLMSSSSPSPSPSPSPSTFLILAHMNEYDDAVHSMLSLQIELFQLFSTLKLLDPLTFLERLQFDDICTSVRRALLQKLCSRYSTISTKWNLQQAKQLLHANFLNILIVDQFELICHWCEDEDEEFCSLFQNSLLESLEALNKHSIVCLLYLIERLCKGDSCSVTRRVKFLKILSKLHQLMTTSLSSSSSTSSATRTLATSLNRPLQMQIERLARRLINISGLHDKNAIYDCFVHLPEEGEKGDPDESEQLQFVILNDLENSYSIRDCDNSPLGAVPNIIDEEWISTQLIKFSTRTNYDTEQIVKVLLEIQTENKLQMIFNDNNFDVKGVLREAISSSLQAMLASFRNNCVQHNPHINYMQLNPLARLSLTALMLGLGRQMKIASRRQPSTKQNNESQQQIERNKRATVISECEADTLKSECDASERDAAVSVCLFEALIALIENIKQIEIVALIYVETKFIDKFVNEHLLRPDYLATLLHFIEWCCNYIQALLSGHSSGNSSSSSRCLPTLTFEQRHQVTVLLRCLDALLHQKFIWRALNQPEKVKALHEGASGNGGGDGDSCIGYGLTKCEQNTIICSLLDVVVCAATLLLENTAFYKKYKNALRSEASSKQNFDNETWLAAVYAPKAIFVGKLIETEIGKQFLASANIEFVGGFCNDNKFKDFNYNVDYIPLQTILSIGVSTLKTHLFYTIAVTPFEIVQEQLKNEFSSGKERMSMHTSMSPTKTSHSYQRDEAPAINRSLPVIPIESLSDVDILRSFVKRLSIFGFTTRQQFEEYFMTFLLLINKVYEENMVDQQEQFQIRSTCLEAIMELLITYKTFPIVGNKLLLYHHTTRWSRINCDSISFKKLHKVQLMIPGSNVFYHPNLERNLLNDTVIGTDNFWVNQYDLNFIWHRMESSSAQHSPLDEGDGSFAFEDEFAAKKSSTTSVQLDNKTANVAYRNFQYFTTHSGIDFKSSTQLIFDVLMQLIEHNHILILPNLVKFVEICEDRDQIKQISKKAAYLQSHIAMDDTVSHQHLIYLLCKTNAMLIPTLAEVQHLEILLKSYLKSSHVFIRCATLCGVLSLLECCHKTNTSIGKLSDELDILKQLSMNYIDKYGVVSESSIQCSDVHTKLVWTLNYCLMEWVWKLDSQFNTSAQVEMAIGKLLKESSNEQIYVCVLHGLERMIVLNNRNCNTVDGQNQLLSTVEKLALELAKVENEKFSIPALKLLVSCIYIGSLKQLENTELSNGIVHDDPEIIVQQTDKVDVLLQCIKTATRETAWIYGQILCQIIRDLVPPKEILTKVIKELLAINHPHSDVIAMIVFQVFRSAIDSSFLQQLQDWLTCSLPTFLSLNEPKAVWSLTVVLLSASINPHLMKLFPLVLNYGVRTVTRTNVAVAAAAAATTTTHGFADDEVTAKLGRHEIGMFVTSAQDFYMKLSKEQKHRFREAFKEFHHIKVYNKMLQSL